MAETAASLDRTRLVEALSVVLDHSVPDTAHVEYCLVGTGAALLHRVCLPAFDIDLLVRNRASVDHFARTLSGFSCIDPPAWLPAARQYYANFEVLGVEVGISTVEAESSFDTIETIGSGPWKHFVHLPCGRHMVPVVRLELRLLTELRRDRPDRYRPLLQHLRAAGCDCDLVRRGIASAGLPDSLRDQVLRDLGA